MLKEKLDQLYEKQIKELETLEGFTMGIITVGNDPASEIYEIGRASCRERVYAPV